MAGSMCHVIQDNRYIGPRLLDHVGDAYETIEELVFILLSTTTETQRANALAEFYKCSRDEQPWPDFMGGVGISNPFRLR